MAPPPKILSHLSLDRVRLRLACESRRAGTRATPENSGRAVTIRADHGKKCFNMFTHNPIMI
jgi:hypothetical protein